MHVDWIFHFFSGFNQLSNSCEYNCFFNQRLFCPVLYDAKMYWRKVTNVDRPHHWSSDGIVHWPTKVQFVIIWRILAIWQFAYLGTCEYILQGNVTLLTATYHWCSKITLKQNVNNRPQKIKIRYFETKLCRKIVQFKL